MKVADFTNIFVDKSKTHTLVGHGVSLDKPDGDIEPIWWPDSIRKGHTLCFGATQVGKSRLIENLIESDIRKGYSCVYIDPKGDGELFEKIVQSAFAVGREKDLFLINPIFPEFSAIINPLAHYFTLEELVAHVIAGIEVKKGDEYFLNIAYQTTLAIVMSLDLLYKQDPENAFRMNLHEINKRCSHSGIRELRNKLDILPYSESAEDLKGELDKTLNYQMEHFSKISSSLSTVLTGMTLGSVGEIIGKAKSNRFIERLERGKSVIMVVQTGSMLTRKTSHIIGRILISMIQSFVGRINASRRKINPPLCLYIDEFAQFIYHGITDLFAQCASAGVWIHAFTQSMADLNDAIGEDAATRILDITNNKIYLRVNHNPTAEYIEIQSGTLNEFDAILSKGNNILIRSVERPVIRMHEILNLPNRTFYFFGPNGRYKGRPEIVTKSFLNIEFPDYAKTGATIVN